MERYEQLVEETRLDHTEHILENPLIKMLMTGAVTHDLYAAYLGQTYHLVRHTSRTLALAAGRCGDDRRGLRAWFIEQAGEEQGHELFCLKDLKNLGLEPATVVDAGPGAGAWGLVAQNYYMATYGNPVGMLGVATATEGLGAQLAGAMAQLLVERYRVPDTAVTFLRSHAGFDKGHLEEARRAVNEYATQVQDYRDVVHARRMTYRYYGRLFRDVAESKAVYFENAQKAA